MTKLSKSTPDKAGKGSSSMSDDLMQEALSHGGVAMLVRLGLTARDELRFKNRIILTMAIALCLSITFHFVQHYRQTPPGLVGETADGRFRPIPLLSEPLYSDSQVREWADKCVQKIYKLSYVDWKDSVRNDTGCLSDKARAGFVDSLKTIGVLKYLTPEIQGQMHAITRTAVSRGSRLTPQGYNEWLVDVPYTIVLDGRQRGSLDVVITLRIRRVSLTWREDGLWAEDYVVKPKSSGK